MGLVLFPLRWREGVTAEVRVADVQIQVGTGRCEINIYRGAYSYHNPLGLENDQRLWAAHLQLAIVSVCSKALCGEKRSDPNDDIDCCGRSHTQGHH